MVCSAGINARLKCGWEYFAQLLNVYIGLNGDVNLVLKGGRRVIFDYLKCAEKFAWLVFKKMLDGTIRAIRDVGAIMLDIGFYTFLEADEMTNG